MTNKDNTATPQIALRQYKESDLPDVHRYFSDPEVVRFLRGEPMTEDEALAFLKQSIAYASDQPQHRFPFAIVLSQTDRVVGGCILSITSPEHREARIAYHIGREHWGRGYATEAVTQLLGWAFATQNLHRIAAACRPENAASVRVLSKVGMTLEGCLREERWKDGRWWDSLCYAILDREWEPASASAEE